MQLGIIGAGRIAELVARRSVAAGDEVMISSRRGPEELAETAAQWSVRAVEVAEAAHADVVVIAVPWPSVPELAGSVALAGRVVVDMTNPLVPPDFAPAELHGKTSSEIVAELFPKAHLVKAYNAWDSSVLERSPARSGGRMVQFVSGDDAAARAVVAEMLGRWGYAVADLGPLAVGAKLLGAPDGALVQRVLIETAPGS